jgi:hypothetical protein
MGHRSDSKLGENRISIIILYATVSIAGMLHINIPIIAERCAPLQEQCGIMGRAYPEGMRF